MVRTKNRLKQAKEAPKRHHDLSSTATETLNTAKRSQDKGRAISARRASSRSAHLNSNDEEAAPKKQVDNKTPKKAAQEHKGRKAKRQAQEQGKRPVLRQIENQAYASPLLEVPLSLKRPRQPRKPRQYQASRVLEPLEQRKPPQDIPHTTAQQECHELVEAAEGTIRTNNSKQQPKGKKRERRLVNVSFNLPAATLAAIDPEAATTEYERQRAERIRQNQERLKQLGVLHAMTELQQSVANTHKASKSESTAKPRQPQKRAARVGALPARKSARLRGAAPSDPSHDETAGASTSAGDTALNTDEPEAAWLSQEEYFKLKGQDISGAIVSDGHFHGWVNGLVCKQFGIEGSATDAWEKNGGGQYSHKIDKKAIPSSLKSKGWSDARAFSATMLKKNPNAYFYRHVAPGQQQAQGDWTQEEHQLFVDTARKYGVGDKWGLFASHIPQRVGYQCSAYYREVIVPAGLVLDKRFHLSRSGKAVFVG